MLQAVVTVVTRIGVPPDAYPTPMRLLVCAGHSLLDVAGFPPIRLFGPARRLPISLPDPLGLPITHLHQLGGLAQSNLVRLTRPITSCPSLQLPQTNSCPSQPEPSAD